MSGMDELLERNRRFAARVGPVGPLRGARVPVFVVTCLDPRVDPAGFLGLAPGDAPVIRNAGGRVGEDVLTEIAFIAELAAQVGAVAAGGPMFEVAIVHHTDCGTALLARDEFRLGFAARTGRDEATLRAAAVLDPHATVRADVARVLASPVVPDAVPVGGYVYDLGTGLVTRVVEAARPQAAVA